MKEKTANPTKKKKLLSWLILAACLLIIAAVTVGVIFAVNNGNGQHLTGDSGQTREPDDSENQNPPDEGNNSDDNDSKDTSSQYEFIVPVKEVNLIKSHEFNLDKTMTWYRLHQAMDFAAPAGTEVMAAVDGTVRSVEKGDILNYATITIDHANGVTTVYKFIDPVENLYAGSKVSRGQVIGKIAAATGVEIEDGDHLHFEVWKDSKPTDPDEYLNITSK